MVNPASVTTDVPLRPEHTRTQKATLKMLKCICVSFNGEKKHYATGEKPHPPTPDKKKFELASSEIIIYNLGHTEVNGHFGT